MRENGITKFSNNFEGIGMWKETKGISLIVLVITIIIIIILAGAIILSLTNTNVIEKASEAKLSNDFVQIRQMVEMAKADAMLNDSNVNVTIPQEYANDITVEPTDGLIFVVSNPNTNLSKNEIGLAIEKLGAVYLPTGFQYLEGTKETGLVIKDVSAGITNNEYVWIPVEGALERKDFLNNPVNYSWYGEDETEGYVSMKTSVETYKGFYVSRYEAGYASASLTPTVPVPDGNIKPLSQKGAYVWNNIAWDETAIYRGVDTQNGAAKVAKMAYNNEEISSSLLYGAQYDAMLKFMDSPSTNVTNSTGWGNHYGNEFKFTGKYQVNGSGAYTAVTGATKPADTSWLLTTGASEQNKSKNIYDVAGNVSEWTYEILPNDDENRVVRSGNFFSPGASSPAASRNVWYANGPGNSYGFRFAFYIK